MSTSTASTDTKYFVIDFDSTFTRVEALDILGEISLEGRADKAERLQSIKDITDLGMEGKLSLAESLEQRLALLDAHQHHLDELISRLRQKVSASFIRNREFLERHAPNIYIISNGFKAFVVPIVSEYGVKPEHVFANTFTMDAEGKITGFDPNNLLSRNGGKAKQIQELGLQGEVIVIGDGHTDYEIKEAGAASEFYAFTENIERATVLAKADHVAPNLDEVLYINQMTRALSYPKNRIKVLLLESIHPEAERLMKEEGYDVEVYPGGLDEDELCERIKGVSILGIRSKTQVTKRVLENANRLIGVGAFCIGTNQIDLDECLRRGVAVFNAPYSNTRSVVELAIGLIILLMRNIPDRSNAMHTGNWDKSAKNSNEVRGKKLGIVGYGSIGKQLSILAENLGMDVYYYDIEEKLTLGNVTKCASMEDLLSTCDIVSLHIDGRGTNENLIGKKEFEQMKEGVIFLNLARGSVVDIDALREAIDSGKVRGTAVDVFPEEPKTNNEEFVSKLRGARNTVLTPHIGGSTEEAQEDIANFVPSQIMKYINTGSTTGSVNFPNLQLPALQNAHRLIHIHRNKPGILARINQVLFSHETNIVGQYLKTNESIGYVITDIDKEYDNALLDDLKAIDDTIRFRVLY